MKKLSNEEAKNVLNNAPEGATHWFVKGEVTRYAKSTDEFPSGWGFYTSGDGCLRECRNYYHEYDFHELSGLRDQLNHHEWDGDDIPPIGLDVMVSYTDTDSDGWCDFHGPSQIIAINGDHCWVAHHGKFHRVHKICDVEFKSVEKEESPEEKSAAERQARVEYWRDMHSRLAREDFFSYLADNVEVE